MKRLLNVLLVLCMLVSLAAPVFAEEDNICGDNMTWEFVDGVLIITGSGDMYDFEEGAPWEAYKKEITRVELSGEITYIGAGAFTNYDALTTVNFGTALYEIGKEAFKSCDGLTVIYLPASFKIFGEGSFSSCSNLNSIHCAGRFPSFKLNCLWDTYGKIYYPADKPWGVEYIEQLETAFKGRIEFLASDGTDHYQPVEPTEEPTEVPTEAPTEAPTEPPTEAPAIIPTEAPTEPPAITEAPETVPVTEVPTEAPLVQEQKPAAPQRESKSWIGLVIIGAAALFVLVGTIATALSNRRGRYAKKRRKNRKR